MKSYSAFFLIFSFMLLAGCNGEKQEQGLIVRLIVDRRDLVYEYPEPITVERFLREAEVEIGPLDRINPQPWTQIEDGIIITIVRVVEDEICEEVEIPYQQETMYAEGLAPNEERIDQVGQNGIEQVCQRVFIEDGVRGDPVETNRTIIRAPQNERIIISPTGELEPVAISGTLVYVNNNNAWMMRGTSVSKRPLTVTGDLEERSIFSLSSDGQRLLIARTPENSEDFGNQLWLIPDVTDDDVRLVPLTPQDVLYAEWVPGTNDTISYSTGEPRDSPPGWQAANDLLIMRIDPQTGAHISINEVVRPSGGGLYGWWGMKFKWSPDGSRLAWVRANGIGLVDLETGELNDPLLEYSEFSTGADWSWRATVSWSSDGDLIVATVHGAPYGNEPASASPIFNIAATAVDGSFVVDIFEKSGMWSTPSFSPEIIDPDNQFPQGHLVFLRAREWEESMRGEYDLVVADRDGSNERIIFPESGQPGLKAQVGELVWSPGGRQLAFIYLGNLWIIDVETGIAHQLTQDGGASNPIWTR
jgi:resuscitation-promoting factor RpfB